ncbi:MAG: hypothetical protein MZU84_02210 [Sphingobacterium sp.]|nr:hypothetical protein [Sphingobacterium sp.]
MAFLPRDADLSLIAATRLIEHAVSQEGMPNFWAGETFPWTDRSLGPSGPFHRARRSGSFLSDGEPSRREDFERKLYVIRRLHREGSRPSWKSDADTSAFYLSQLVEPDRGLQGSAHRARSFRSISRTCWTSAVRKPVRPGSSAVQHQHAARPGRWPSRSATWPTTARSTRCAATSTACAPARRMLAVTAVRRGHRTRSSRSSSKAAATPAIFDNVLELLVHGGPLACRTP